MKKSFRYILIFVIFIILNIVFNGNKSSAKEYNYQVYLSQNTILIELPEEINISDYQKYLDNTLSDDRQTEIEEKIEKIKEEVTRKVELDIDYVYIEFTDKKGNIIFPLRPDEGAAPTEILIGPPETNDIEFDFITDLNDLTKDHPNCPGLRAKKNMLLAWQPHEIAILEQAASNGKDILKELIGPPLTNYAGEGNKMCVAHGPNWISSGQFMPSANAIVLRHPCDSSYPNCWNPIDTIEKGVFWHETTHAFYGRHATNFLYSYVSWGEAFAQIGEHIVSKEVGYEIPHLPIETSDYEQFNKPYFDSRSMRSMHYDSLSNPQSDQVTTSYTTAPTFWLKLYREYPEILKELNAQIYELYRDGGNPEADGYKLDREFIAIVQTLINSYSNNTVEGEPFMDWYAKQYPTKQTTGYKFGTRLISDFEKVKIRLSYYHSRKSNDEHSDDDEKSGQVNYEIINNLGEVIYQSSLINIDGYIETDITNIFGGSIPQGKFCLKAHLSDPNNWIETDNSSCYYLRGSIENEQDLGFVGTIGDYNDVDTDGEVLITPLRDQTVPSNTVQVFNGGFVAPLYYDQGGLYRLDYTSQDGYKKATKYITKDKNDYYYTNLSLESQPPLIMALSSSSISSGNSAIISTTEPNTALIYYVNQVGKDKYLYTKDWNSSFSYYRFITQLELQPEDTYSLQAARPSGKSANGPDFPFGRTEKAYLSKWAEKYEGVSRESINFYIRASRMAGNQFEINVTDDLAGFSSEPYEISHSGIYSNGVITWPTQYLVNPSILYSFKIPL